MLKKGNQKTKRVVFLIWAVSFISLAGLAIYAVSPYISVNLALNIFPFLSSSTKSGPPFYGENIDMSQVLPTSQHYVVNSKGQDLIDIAASLGINLVRITNVQRSFNNNEDSLYTKAQWNQVLNKMQSKGIKAIILIEVVTNDGTYYNPEIQPAYMHLVQEYIASGVFSHPDVYAADIKNEPLLTDTNLKMLQAAHDMIKAKYPDLKQTVGSWASPKSSQNVYTPDNYNWTDYSAGQKLDTIVDFYCIHMYGLDTNNFGLHLSPDMKTKVFISQVEHGLQTQKSILIEEFGEANGDTVSDQDTIGNPQLQANVYQGVYQALKEMHSSQLIGAVAFDFYSRDPYPDAWAIVKDNGNYLFPAAYILQAYALGMNTSSLQASTIVTSQSYLVTNADNHTTKNLHVSDRIGLELQLDDSKSYVLSLSTQGILQLTQVLYYYPVSDSYDAMYQAKGKGTVQITINPYVDSTKKDMDTAAVYTLTITVQ